MDSWAINFHCSINFSDEKSQSAQTNEDLQGSRIVWRHLGESAREYNWINQGGQWWH